MTTPISFKGDVILTANQYQTLKNSGSITVGDTTLTYDASGATRYVTEEFDPVRVELLPSSATSGNLSNDNLSNLINNDDAYIILNGEYYRLAGNIQARGIRTYTHTGWNGEVIQDKSINITTATRAWTLVTGQNTYYRHYIKLTLGDKTLYYNFSSTQSSSYTADTLPSMPNNTITSFELLSNGYYSNVSGLIYRNDTGNLKAVAHGMYTDNGTSMTYLNVTDADVTLVSDTVTALYN